MRDCKEVIWALTTRVDPARDTLIAESTPIDYLDFASPVSGLGSKMGIDATHKWPAETARSWGEPIAMSDDPPVVRRILEHLGRWAPEARERSPPVPPKAWPANTVLPLTYHPVPDIA